MRVVIVQMMNCARCVVRGNKKPRYREEHSASVVLSLCTS